MKLEIGKKYKTRSGKEVWITRSAPEKTRYPIFGVIPEVDNVECWMDNGRYSFYQEEQMDLIEEVA